MLDKESDTEDRTESIESRAVVIHTPKVLGRFNYMSVRRDLYNIMFIPFNGPAAITIARNLPYKEMNDTILELNESLEVLKEDLHIGGIEND